MTDSQRWKIAKWVKRNGDTARVDVPHWFPVDATTNDANGFFTVVQCDTTISGEILITERDLFSLSDKNIDDFKRERMRRIHSFRDWIVPSTSIAAIIISILALVVATVSLLLQIK